MATSLRTATAAVPIAPELPVGAFPLWLTVLTSASLLLAIVIAAGVAVDVARHPQRMG